MARFNPLYRRHNRLRQYRRQHGLCRDCGRPARSGRQHCARHAALAAEASRQRRARQIAAGICERAGCHRSPIPGRTLCGRHVEELNARCRRYQQRAKTLSETRGLCRRCRKARVEPPQTQCPACVMHKKAWHERRREEWQRKTRCGRCGVRPHLPGRRWCQHCCRDRRAIHHRARARTRAWEQERRRTVIAHYGGRCACCGVDEPDFLTIHHVNGRGGQHRRRVGNVYRWLARNRYPDGYAVLCQNCHASIHRNKGCCVHRANASVQPTIHEMKQ